MEIKKANSKILIEIEKYLDEVVNEMISQNNPQWTKIYPTIKDFEMDIDSEQLYYFIQNNKIVGVTALTTEFDEWFYQEPHKNKAIGYSNEVYYVHRMMIFPPCRGKKLGSEMYKKIINKAVEDKKIAVQVDTHESNMAMNKTNQKSGSNRTGIRGRKNRQGNWITYEYYLK